MTSIQRVGASAVQLNPEANFSLFHANFDFSLFKCEAPAELVPLGECLSRQRRQLAEEGSFHILARRLGILFEEILPDVPCLLKAYGTRASEIARELDKAGSRSKSIADGIFGPHLGIDSTSIWAGATSGSSALLMHLLACMLARIWSPQEATAIWTELVDQRRRDVKSRTAENDRTSNFFAHQAALYETDWSSLQSWDASARAWLQIADNSSMKLRQKQIELIANNLSVAVQTQVTPDGVTLSTPGKESVHDSVLHNFCSALSTMNSLVVGKPQRILDGGVLLGLTSWHLYPDLVLLGQKTQEVFQEDALVVPSGIATLSIAYQEDPHGNQDGVYWSLPLASLRYYGTVQRRRSSLHDSKLSFSGFQALILGASLESLDCLSSAVDILKALWTFNYTAYQDALREAQGPDSNQWTSHLSTPYILQEDLRLAQFQKEGGKKLRDIMDNLHLLLPLIGGVDLLTSEVETERKTALQLIRYGANSATGWIGNVKENTYAPFFGVSDLAFILQALSNPTDRVQVLRAICQSHSCEPDACIIRFRRDDDTWAYASISQTAIPPSRKRKRSQFEADADETPGSSDEEWVFLSSKTDLPSGAPGSLKDYNLDSLQSDDSGFHDYIFPEFLVDSIAARTTVVWEFMAGVHNLAAVYIRRSRPAKEKNMPRPTVPLPMIRDLIHSGSLNLKATMAWIQNFFATHQPDHHFSLLALGRIIDHYKRDLPHLTLSMSITKQPPRSWTWAKSVVRDLETQHIVAASLARDGVVSDSIYPSPLTRQQAFASILQFESGTLSVDLGEMDPVMAISSGNSLFVAQRLLHDPIPPAGMASCAVAHAIGNVGKPGIALLFAPEQPLVRAHDVEKWHVVNHSPFDGNPAGGSFEASSLHMSFTGWEGPLRVRGPSAFRGLEAYHLETQVSMYDQGEWVADLNVLKALDSSPDLRVCGVHEKHCGHDPSIAACGVEFACVDCWEELLSPAHQPMVLRSGASWMARLTGVSIAHSQGFRCFLLPVHRELCWTCVVDEANARQIVQKKVLFVY
ncbi:hypothetical protein BDW62DRAFT_193436 [Aspergillus aurantiobrunneus]